MNDSTVSKPTVATAACSAFCTLCTLVFIFFRLISPPNSTNLSIRHAVCHYLLFQVVPAAFLLPMPVCHHKLSVYVDLERSIMVLHRLVHKCEWGSARGRLRRNEFIPSGPLMMLITTTLLSSPCRSEPRRIDSVKSKLH